MERQTNRDGAKSGHSRGLSIRTVTRERVPAYSFPAIFNIENGVIKNLFRGIFCGSVFIIRSKWSVSSSRLLHAIAAQRLRKFAENARPRYGVRWPGIKTQSRLPLDEEERKPVLRINAQSSEKPERERDKKRASLDQLYCLYQL